jgi:hypothetical protein
VGRPERTVLAIGGAVLALVVVAVAAALAFGSSDPDDFPPDSPAGVLQQFIVAVRDGDTERALSLLSTRARQELERTPGSAPFSPFCFENQDQRIRVKRTIDRGDRATLILEIEQFSGEVLDFDRYEYEREVPFVREDGAWKIDEAYLCF